MAYTFDEVEKQLKKHIERLSEEMKKIRGGGASIAIVEDILVDVYGSKTPVKALATIRCPDPRTLVVEPWDKSALEAIASAISKAQNGLQASVVEDVVRIPFPPLSEERREEFVKFASQKTEETKVQIRQFRDEVMKDLERQEKEKEISEDEKFRTKEKLEKLFKEYTARAEEIREAKEEKLRNI